MPNYKFPSNEKKGMDIRGFSLDSGWLPTSPRFRREILKAQLKELRREIKELENTSVLPTPEWMKPTLTERISDALTVIPISILGVLFFYWFFSLLLP